MAMNTMGTDMVPNFIKASSPIGLRRAMWENNVKKNQVFSYFDITFAKNQWYAWYLEKVSKPEDLTEDKK